MTRARTSRTRLLWAVTAVGLALLAPTASAVSMKWVKVEGAGNTCNPYFSHCWGAVAQDYRIGKYEVTNRQYTGFLNAVADDVDTFALYSGNMASAATDGGIKRTGSSGDFTYSTLPGRADMPVNWVTYWDSLRFSNWLHNGQPTGFQDNATTEDGAYTITQAGIDANSIERNGAARIFLPSEDEWYKAAYYDVVGTSYFDFPAGSDTETTCALPGGAANTANCGHLGIRLTDVGSYTGSASPNGTLDQGGNVFEWNETSETFPHFRSMRGGSFASGSGALGQNSSLLQFPFTAFASVGIRVARIVPEPNTGLLVLAGLLSMAISRSRKR